MTSDVKASAKIFYFEHPAKMTVRLGVFIRGSYHVDGLILLLSRAQVASADATSRLEEEASSSFTLKGGGVQLVRLERERVLSVLLVIISFFFNRYKLGLMGLISLSR
jgi:hypothetical protein